jgi:peptide/nickel transport system ATP-binding protein
VTLLEVEDLQTSFRTASGPAHGRRGLSFEVNAGETLAVVGESGSGKSVTALSIMGLLKPPAADVTGRVRLQGRELLGLSERELRALRGSAIGMVFQEPMASLNPVLSIGFQVGEAIRLHRKLGSRAVRDQSETLLRQVGIAAPARVLRLYPHQLSGGMCQRVMIAIAVACDPMLLIADEPTTALDVTVQAQILALIRSLQARSRSGVLLITHDLGVVAELADRVIIMYAGRKVEEAGVETIFARPRHPYTRGLLAARPRLGVSGETGQTRLVEIPGSPPRPGADLPGCAFRERCPAAIAICGQARPPLVRVSDGHIAACHRLEPAYA